MLLLRTMLNIQRSLRIGTSWHKVLQRGPACIFSPSAPTVASCSCPTRTLSTSQVSGGAWEGEPTADSSRYEHLLVTFRDGVRTITFNRPEKKNAINERLFVETVVALAEASSDPHTIVTAVTGAGNVYTAGFDKTTFQDTSINDMRDILTNHMRAFVDFPKPLVAVVNGAAAGVGTTLLPQFDAVYASDKAIFFTPFSALNITVEGCSSYTFPRLMGQAKAAEILIFNKKIGAKEAFKLGLVTQVFPDGSFYEEVWPRLEAMAKLPLKSLMYSKALMRNVVKDTLHKVNAAECRRVAERLSLLQPNKTKEEYEEYVAANFKDEHHPYST